MRPVFVVNPLSETVARKGSLLKARPADPNLEIPLFEIDFSGSVETLLEHCLEAGSDHIFIEGGDGTAQGILTAFLRRRAEFTPFPKFTLLPGGMTNQVAKMIGTKRNEISPTNILNQISSQQLDVPLLRIQCEGHPDYYGFLFSTGAVPMVTDYTKNTVHKKGIGGSTAVAAGILRAVSGKSEEVMRPTPLELTVEGPEKTIVSENHLGTLATTLPGLILGLDPFWGTQEAPIRTTIAGNKTRRLFRNILSLWIGRKKIDRTKDGLRSVNATSLHYEYSGPIVLDGEFLDFYGHPFTVTTTDPVEFIK